MPRPIVWLIFPLGLGCNSLFKVPDDSGDDGYGAFSNGSADHHGLPDINDGLDRSGCDIQEATGVAGPGATSYFYGEVWEEDGDWIGYERWILFANETWSDQGGYDCEETWTLEVVETGTGACGGCDIGLELTALLDASASDCPEDTVAASDHTFTETYALRLESNGDATWFFAASGNQLGEGYHHETAMNYLSPKSCRWF
jgi:hypothetical protein